MGGRVKTLHPRVHGGILARPGHEGDAQDMREAGIEPIDLVVVNLYPFEETAARRGAAEDEIVEQIDIGGPAMVRAAAKNFARVGVVTSPDQYAEVLDELRGGRRASCRRRCAGAWRRRPSAARPATTRRSPPTWPRRSDDFPAGLVLNFDKQRELSYGENPHQRAAYYAERGARRHLLSRTEQLHGKELSFNNLYDLDAGLGAAGRVRAAGLRDHQAQQPVRRGRGRRRRARPTSAPATAIRCRRTGAWWWSTGRWTAALGEMLAGTFVEVLCAPGYDDEALRGPDRASRTPASCASSERRRRNPGERDLRRVVGGLLVQDRDAESEDRVADEGRHRAGAHRGRVGRPAVRVAGGQAREEQRDRDRARPRRRSGSAPAR